MTQNDAPDKIQWHPAFCSAARLELRSDLAVLDIIPEVSLSKKPLSMDILVIKKIRGGQLDNEIGKIFKRYNVIEYKSPEDGLTIDDYFKTIAYACLYKAQAGSVDGIPEREVTVSLFREAFPKELFATLRDSGREIKEAYPGIYYISGNVLFDTQVVVIGQLNRETHRALRMLTRNMKEEDAREFLEEVGRYTEKSDREDADAVLRVSVSANWKVYEKLRRDGGMTDVLELLMQDVIEERVREASKRTAEQAAEKAAREAERVRLFNIRSLMDTLNLTPEQAMNALRIPPEEQGSCLKSLGEAGSE